MAHWNTARKKIPALLKKQGGRCKWCGVPIFDARAWKQRGVVERLTSKYIVLPGGSMLLLATIDHIKPISQGGMSNWDNIVASCFRCNQRRGRESNPHYGVKTKQPLITSNQKNEVHGNGLRPAETSD